MAAIAVHDAWVEAVETLVRRLMTARDIDTLACLMPESRRVAYAMIEADAGGGFVARTLSALNDVLVVRIIELAAARHRLPTANWCWLAMGSEGRGERTFVADQDNGIIFGAVDASEARALRPLFMAFAYEVNQALAACGIPLCEGGIMASNARCCLSLAEWCDRFANWVRMPEPQALLNAAIFFDLRPLHGDIGLAARLREYLACLVDGANAFKHMLAANALAAEPPVGTLRDFVAPEGTIDLKKFGARIFVDGARILGLAAPDSSTVARLRHASHAGVLAESEAVAARGAFHQLQRIRLVVQQRALLAGGSPDNQVALEALNGFDRQVLHEALKQARLLQQKLRIVFRIEG